MVGRKFFHELLELIAVASLAGSEKFLNDFEHRNDMALCGLAEFRHQQNGCSQKSFGGIIEVGVLSEVTVLHAGENNRLGDDLCVLFRLGFVLHFIRSGIQIHVLVDEVQKIVSV